MTISVREGLLEPIFCVLRVRNEISVMGGGGAAEGCFRASSSDVRVGGGVWFVGQVQPVLILTGESCGDVIGVGPSEGDKGGPLSRSGEAGGEWSNGYSTGGGVWKRILKFGSAFHP